MPVSGGPRPYTMRDMTRTRALIREVFKQEHEPTLFQSLHVSWPEGMLVYQEGLELVGFLLPIRLEANQARILLMGIDLANRGKGYGSSMMEMFICSCKAYNIEKLFLEVRVNNHVGIAFYTRYGFSTLSLINGYYKDGSDAYLMGRIVPK